ncbi:MAG: hypothetical protein ACYC7F_01505 [Gemmatimonadaceae bacterium]
MSSAATIYLGLDVHKESVTIAVLPSGARAPTRIDKLPNDLAKLRRFCERHASRATAYSGASGQPFRLDADLSERHTARRDADVCEWYACIMSMSSTISRSVDRLP